MGDKMKCPCCGQATEDNKEARVATERTVEAIERYAYSGDLDDLDKAVDAMIEAIGKVAALGWRQ